MTTETTLLESLNAGLTAHLRSFIRDEVERFFNNGNLATLVRNEALKVLQSEPKDADDEHIKSLIEDGINRHERIYDHDAFATEEYCDDKVVEEIETHKRDIDHLDKDDVQDLISKDGRDEQIQQVIDAIVQRLR